MINIDRREYITEKQYNYLLPALKNRLYACTLKNKTKGFYFIGNDEQIKDMYARLAYLD